MDAVFVCYAMDRDTSSVTQPQIHEVFSQARGPCWKTLQDLLFPRLNPEVSKAHPCTALLGWPQPYMHLGELCFLSRWIWLWRRHLLMRF